MWMIKCTFQYENDGAVKKSVFDKWYLERQRIDAKKVNEICFARALYSTQGSNFLRNINILVHSINGTKIKNR